jgi:hypothetical protein
MQIAGVAGQLELFERAAHDRQKRLPSRTNRKHDGPVQPG